VSRAFLPFLALMMLLACGSSGGSDTLPPLTGVVVRAESLTTGRGCGRGTTQIFKYAAVVLGLNPDDRSRELPDAGDAGDTNEPRRDQFLAGNVYDCFTDGLFVDLPPSAGSVRYEVRIYAYNEAAYLAAGEQQIRSAAGNRFPFPGTNPTFSTTCDAQQTDLVQSLAFCQPLAVGLTGVDPKATQAPSEVELSLAAFPGPDGGILTCDGQYTRVRSRFATDGTFNQPSEVACNSSKLTIAPAAAPASYLIEVALLQANGTVAGQTTCRAETSPGTKSVANCKPIQ
jgi:hypothetical protein